MARSIKIIKGEIIGAIMQQDVLVNAMNLDSTKSFEEQTSKLNLIGFMAYAVAVGIYSLEKLFDQFKYDIDIIVRDLKPHGLRWYNTKIRAFQLGHVLPEESDRYAVIEESAQIIKFSAVDEVYGQLLVKVAKADNAINPAPLSSDELKAFETYMSLIKDAGVEIKTISAPGDKLALVLDIYYDPLVLNEHGVRLDGQDDAPVQKAIRNFIKKLPFNGVFTLAHLVDALQATEGVKIPKIISCETQYGNLPFTQVNAFCTPDAGYLELVEEDEKGLTINWIAHV